MVAEPDGHTRALPLSLTVLIWLTTQPYKPGRVGDFVIDHALSILLREGWVLRMAPRRNYLLWRSGETQTRTDIPLLVLPIARYGMESLEWRGFLIGECLRAVLRAGVNSLDATDTSYPDLARELAEASGLSGEAIMSIHARCERRVLLGFTGSPAH